RGERRFLTKGLPVELHVADQKIQAVIVPVDDAETLRREMITSKDFRVLSEIIVPAGIDHESEVFTKALSDLCLVLSVARGTRVQWVYREDWADATLVKRSHRTYLTKQYCPLAPIQPDYEHAKDTERFISDALSALRSRAAFELGRGTIAVYLDA